MSVKIIASRVALIMLLGAGVFAVAPSHAQSVTTPTASTDKNIVKGVVLDSKKQPIIGATVVVKGTSNGTATTVDGSFSITAAQGTELSISCLGFQTLDVAAVAGTPMSIVMGDDSEMIEEVVVVGYGVVKKSDLTSSIATVKGEELEKVTTSSPMTALQGKVAGVQITNGSGAPGSSPTVIIRGVTTQNGSEPLYVVDGIPGVSLSSINSNDIKSMEILKDAAATSIYGTRGANGVVLVTTKTGTKNTPFTVNIDARQGFQHMSRPSIAGADEYMQVYTASYENDGTSIPYSFDGAVDTDWWAECIEPVAMMSDYNMSFSGGGEKLVYSGSMGYFNQESQMKDKGYWNRMTARINMDYTVNDHIKFGVNVAPRWQKTENYYNAISAAMQYDPTTAVYIPADEQEGVDEYSIYDQSTHCSVWNPVATQARTLGENDYFGFMTNAYLEVKPVKDLIIRTQFGYKNLYSESRSFSPEFNLGGTEKNDVNKVSQSSSSANDWVWNNTATYIKKVQNHNFTGMVGFVVEESNSNTMAATKEGVANNYNDALRYLNAATSNATATGIEASSSLLSYLARFMYNYDNRYYLTATCRVDGSSKFGADNRYATFPSISTAYNIKNEKFMEDVDLLSALKLRASWGMVGNQSIPSGVFEDQISQTQIIQGNEVVTGSKLSQLANESLTWEIVEDYNIGVDLGIGKHIKMSAEWFNKESHDMLMEAKVLSIVGLPTSGSTMWTNIGSMRARGFEFSLNYSDYSKKLKYDIGFNLSKVKNTAQELIDGAPQYNGSYMKQTTHKTEEGGEIGQFFIYEADGLFQSQEEINSHTDINGNLIQPNAQPGDVRFVDHNGDGQLTDDDKIYAGSSLPPVTFGLNVYLEYKGFDLTMSASGNIGNKIFNSQRCYTETAYSGTNVREGLMSDVWTPSNPGGTVPRLTNADLNGNYTKPSTLLLESGSYMKIQNLQLGYSFKIKKLKDLQCRVFVSGQNLCTFTKYSGADPEAASSGSSVLSSGIDWYPYAQPRTYILGVNFKL